MKLIFLLSFFLVTTTSWGRSHVIFSMTQDLSMGEDNEVIRKNYYVNMGSGQGLKKDSVLNVFRIISVQNPYDNKKRVNYKIKIGELKVLHTSDDAAIAMVNKYETEKTPILELPQFMIGDHVSVSVD
jgi:hypothetical protein